MRRKVKIAITALVIGFGGPLVAAAAHAQEGGVVCTSDRKEALAKLGATYSEARVHMGLATNGSMIEVFTTIDGTTWTIALTRPDGLLCMMAAGEHWETFPFNLPEAEGSGT